MSGPKNNCRMKKALKGVLDGLRVSSLSQQTRVESEIDETLRTEHFHLSKTVRHGFPYQPVSMAFDPVQHILAIGTRNGSLRIFGRPGVDCHLRHDGDIAVLQVIFLINEGALVTMCSDDTLHLWNFRQKRPAIAHSLKFQRESLTYIHLPFQSKWLYVGTERGNVHIINIESFVLSGYVINWNKAIELSRKTHPGPVVHLSDNPMDPNKLLIGFESGAIVLWDLKSKTAEHRYSCHEALRSISWHHEGRQFMCSHVDGSLTTWIARNPQKPQNILYPHAKMGKDGKPDPCKPIAKLQWCSTKSGEPFVIFSGGMSYDKAGRTPSITVMHGKNTTVLEMEHSVTDFVTLAETPWSNDFQEPYGIVVLLDNDLVVVDLTTEGYPCFENPYPMDIHESPVTACYYFADCPTDLIPAFYSVGSKQKKSGFSEKDWPIRGGEWGTSTCSYPEIMITGHADGSVKIWDATSVTLQVLYKLKTAKVFERPRSKPEKGQEPDEDPFAIQNIFLDAESRVLTIAGLTHVLVFKFSKQESIIDLPFLEISLVYEVFDDLDSPDIPEFPKPNTGLVPQHSSSVGSYSSTASDSRSENLTSIKVKQGCRKWSSGYQPEIVCLLTYVDGEPASSITSISVNSSYGLLAFGNESGLAIVDIIQKTCLLNMGTPDLYGSLDPYQRVPRSPKSKKAPECVGQSSTEENKSPTSDQINGVCISPTTNKQTTKKQHPPELRRTKSQDKNDGSFSRSRSSSMSSLENISKEAIQCLSFADAYTRKTGNHDSYTCPCLWVGTSLGSVLVINLQLPIATEARQTEPVTATPSGTIFRLKGTILAMSFLDCNGILIPAISEQWKDFAREMEKDKGRTPSKLPRQVSVNKPRMSPTSSTEILDRQFAIICSEKQARVMSLPSQTCAYKVKITETSFVIKADVVNMKDSVCLTCYVANGHLMAFSLPSLKPLLDVDFLPLTDLRIARTFSISNNGHALFFCSPTEVQKLTYAADMCENLQEMLGELFLPVDAPEPPKQGFFKNLFSGGGASLDREELFGESSGKASKGLAKHIPGSGLQGAQEQAGAVLNDFQRTRQALTERGEKLGELDERTAQMMAQAESYAKACHALNDKYKNKKWYQF
ncbi:syntaxin-binding protein 5-like isoform X7 [Lineus longissimus]|uniref:syntaxin-binding protein 5-like isoform X7 n=1 Tax=Lineus longissimus TaxID=88925 RepID=UPI00315D3CB7